MGVRCFVGAVSNPIMYAGTQHKYAMLYTSLLSVVIPYAIACVVCGDDTGHVVCFFSERKHGAAFAVLIAVNNVSVARMNACCEFRHTPGKHIGVNSGFVLDRVQGGDPCLKCKIRDAVDGKSNYNTTGTVIPEGTGRLIHVIATPPQTPPPSQLSRRGNGDSDSGFSLNKIPPRTGDISKRRQHKQPIDFHPAAVPSTVPTCDTGNMKGAGMLPAQAVLLC